MIAISFLGIANYQETTYVWREQSCTTCFFTESLPHFYPELERVLLFVTPTVQNHANFCTLTGRMGEIIQPIAIPEGHSEQELWQIFDRLTSVVPEDSEVLFDITNSYRSLPFVIFLAAAYLRTARRVKVKGVLYGAFEARDGANRSPIFDLSPFIALLDWLTATNQFVHTGDARYLARLLADAGSSGDNRAMASAAEPLRDLSLAMMLCRPLEVMERAGALARVLPAATGELTDWSRPFALLAGRIDEEYSKRALADPTSDVEASLRQQLLLIDWYLRHDQTIQGMSLAREWVVTAVGWQLGLGFVLRRGSREEIERAINGVTRVGQRRDDQVIGTEDLSEMGRIIWEWPERSRLRELWSHLSAVRNDLDHAGMSTSPMSAQKLARKAQADVWPRMIQLAGAWGIEASEGS